MYSPPDVSVILERPAPFSLCRIPLYFFPACKT